MKNIFLCALFCVSINCLAQVVTVRDLETKDPLGLVSFFSGSPSAIAVTNADGQADLTEFKEAKTIVIRLMGYKTEVRSYAELAAANFELVMTSTNIVIDQIVVSATKWNQVSNEIPGKVSTISIREIALQNPQTTADLLGNSGDVFIQKSQQGGGSPMIRGFATNRLLYTVDGIRMNSAIFRSGNIQNVISLDAFATEKAEVLFGPGSVIYGSDAIGGVMSFQTLTPQLTLKTDPLIKGSAVFRTSSANNEKTGHFDVNIGWRKWALLSSMSANNFDHLKMGSYGPDEYLLPYYVERLDSVDVIVTNDDPRVQRPSAYSQMNLMQKIRFTPNKKWDFQYGFHYSETSSYGRYDRHIRYKNGLPRYGEWSYGPQKWMMNNLTIAHSGKNKIYDRMTLRLAQQVFEESRMDRNINDPERHIREEKVDAYSINLDFLKSLGTRHKLCYGLEMVQNLVESSGTDEDIVTGGAAIGPSRYPQSSWASYAAYLSYQLKASEKFFVQAGVRYNQYMLNATFDTTFYPFPYTTANLNEGALTGSLGFVWRPTEKWAISMNGATGFRAPNVDDMGKVFDSEPGSVIVPNPGLRSEYAYNADLGVAKVFGESVKIDLTGYYTLLQNAMVRRDFTLNGMDSVVYDGATSKVQAIQNAAVATVYGLQAGLEIKFPKGFGFSSKFNAQIGEEELDDATVSPSRHAAPMFGVSRITYSAHNLNFELYGVYSGGKTYDQLPDEEKAKTEIYATDANGNPHSPVWYTLNFKALYRFSTNFTVSAGVENITDQRYRPYSSGMCGSGRNFILSLRVAF